MALEGICFDLYGTLLAYGDMEVAWSDWLAALHRSLERSGFAVDPESLAGRCDGILKRPVPTVGEKGLTVYERRIAGLFAEMGIGATSEQIRAASSDTVDAWHRHLTLDPEATEVLRGFKARFKLALVSNFDHPPPLRRLLADTGLEPLFDALVISAEVGLKKPDPRIFDLALARLGLKADSAAHVGDAPEDMEGAAAAGLLPVLIDRDGDTRRLAASDFRSAGSADPESWRYGGPKVGNLKALIALFGEEE